MVCPVNANDEIIVPLFDAENKPVTIKWSQNLSERTGVYYALQADNVTSGESFPFFIAAEYYKSSTSANPSHITKAGTLVDGEGYKLRVGNRLQYGQKDASGELRFVVFHDKERKPYQHRFIESAIGSAGSKKANDIAASFGAGAIVGGATDLLKNFVGDYLHTF